MTLVMLLFPVQIYMSMTVRLASYIVKVEVMLYPDTTLVMAIESVSFIKKFEGSEARDHIMSGVGIPNATQVNVRLSV